MAMNHPRTDRDPRELYEKLKPFLQLVRIKGKIVYEIGGSNLHTLNQWQHRKWGPIIPKKYRLEPHGQGLYYALVWNPKTLDRPDGKMHGRPTFEQFIDWFKLENLLILPSQS
jgi:hypothetical protein